MREMILAHPLGGVLAGCFAFASLDPLSTPLSPTPGRLNSVDYVTWTLSPSGGSFEFTHGGPS